MKTELYDSAAYRRSRAAYVTQCALGYFVTLLVSDAYVAKLLLEAGIDAATVGVISTLEQLSCVPALFAIVLDKYEKSAKQTLLITRALSMFLFAVLYLVPFMAAARPVRTFLAIIVMFGGHFCLQLTEPEYVKWSYQFVKPDRRSRFSAAKQMISLLSGVVFTFLIGMLFDRYEADGRLRDVFLTAALMICVINLLSTVCLCMMSKDKRNTAPVSSGGAMILKDLKNLFADRRFLHVVILTTLFSFGQYLTNGFMGTYKTVELAFSVGTVQLINAFGFLGRFVISMPVGAYSDRRSYAKGYTLSLLFMALAFCAGTVTRPNTRGLIVVYTLLYYFGLAGTGYNTINMCYSCVSAENVVPALAIRGCVSGVCAFAASLLGSAIMKSVLRAGNRLFGLPVYGQQVLSLLSLLTIAAAIVYAKKVVEKEYD